MGVTFLCKAATTDEKLNEKGWKVVIIWECEISSFLENPSTLTQRIFE